MQVEVSAAEPVDPDYDSFAWQVLGTLATDAAARRPGTGSSRSSLTMSPGETGAGL